MSVKITASTNVQALKSSRGLTGLVNKHLNDNVRDKLKNVRPELVGLNQRYKLWSDEELTQWRQGLEDSVEAYNKRPSQRKNKARRLENCDEFVERSRAKKGVDGDFYGTEFMMVAKLGNQADWLDLVERFGEQGVSEAELLESLNKGFIEHAEWFNSEFNKDGLAATQVFTNLDEIGAPHSHLHIVSTKVNAKTGLPIVNFGAILGERYGDTLNKYSMRKFRNELDEKLVSSCSEAIKELAVAKGVPFSGLDMVRLKAEQVGLSHERYVKEQEAKAEALARVNERSKAVDERERKLNAKEKALTTKEAELNERERKLENVEVNINNSQIALKNREDKVSKREADVEASESKLFDTKAQLDMLLRDLPDFGQFTKREQDMMDFMAKYSLSVNGKRTSIKDLFIESQKPKEHTVAKARNNLKVGSSLINEYDLSARRRALEQMAERENSGFPDGYDKDDLSWLDL